MKFETARIHFLSDVSGLLSSRNFATEATSRNDFSFLLSLDMVFQWLTISQNWIRSMKFETARIHFLSDVSGLLSSRNFATEATSRNDFSFLLSLDMVFQWLTISQNWIRSMKFETARIHFLSDVSGLLSSRNFATEATSRNDFSFLLSLDMVFQWLTI